MSLLRRVLLVSVVLVPLTTAGGASATTQPIERLVLRSRVAIAPGIYFTHWRARVSGVSDLQDVYRVSWTLGDPHVHLHAALMGARHVNGSVDIRPISRWAALARPSGLVAAVNGDFFSWSSSTTATPSGMLVRGRRLIQAGWGGQGGAPSVGFAPGGSLVFGRPHAPPVKFLLPGGHSATIAGFAAAPRASDQVGAYVHAGTVVPIPSGD
ncbi:MAG TPA: hypothetical protein VFW18_05710, partial [Gaiellales bacterium]|nr:hypothetical protein [Gaiellales bacterium]